MDVVSIVVLAIIVVAIGYLIMLYNGLVQVKHNVSKAWANIDVLLKQRHDELPKLIETCKQYMKFEQELRGVDFQLPPLPPDRRHADFARRVRGARLRRADGTRGAAAGRHPAHPLQEAAVRVVPLSG